MANNFFDLVKPSFFKPFANGDVRLNYDLLQLINNKLLLDNLQVGKEEIVDWIIEYVDNCPTKLFDCPAPESVKFHPPAFTEPVIVTVFPTFTSFSLADIFILEASDLLVKINNILNEISNTIKLFNFNFLFM